MKIHIFFIFLKNRHGSGALQRSTIWHTHYSALLSDKKPALAIRSHIGTRSYNRSELSSRIWQLTVTTWNVSQAWENSDQSQDE